MFIKSSIYIYIKKQGITKHSKSFKKNLKLRGWKASFARRCGEKSQTVNQQSHLSDKICEHDTMDAVMFPRVFILFLALFSVISAGKNRFNQRIITFAYTEIKIS